MANIAIDRLSELGMPSELGKEIIALSGPNTEVAGLTPLTTPDATDAATTQALANACKAKINEIIAALQS